MSSPSILRQPKAVWAVAFASVVAFMGIGLVDPILPAIAKELSATPAQTELLFTSYLFITGLAMLVTSFVSSRIGPRATLLIGLAVIVVFALCAALSNNVNSIIGFRAGWGLGNALFISTALATIVGAASGGKDTAIILYEAALGLGIAIGPLLGGLLGRISWRGPFFGVSTLMAVGFVLIAVLLRGDAGERSEPTRLSAPIRALRQPPLAVLAVTALLYNIGFFSLLAWTPFALPSSFDALDLGFTFFGWGVAVAVSSVWIAPLLTRRLRRSSVLVTMLALLAIDLVAMGVFAGSAATLVTLVIVGGLMLGVMNTVLTESVMAATDLPRTVASSAYSAVRFIGGAIAPPLMAAIAAAAHNLGTPYYFGAGALVISLLTVLVFRRALTRVDAEHELEGSLETQAILLGDATAGA